MKVKKMAKNGQKGQNCYPLSPAFGAVPCAFIYMAWLGVGEIAFRVEASFRAPPPETFYRQGSSEAPGSFRMESSTDVP